jgi:hypothetical protein
MPGVRSSHHGSVFLFVNKFLGVTRQKVGGVRGSVCRADTVIRIGEISKATPSLKNFRKLS